MFASLLDVLPFTLRGLGLGLAIAAPVGPIGILTIRRTLADGRLTGFVTGLGAATADGIYGAVAAFGISSVAVFLTDARFWVHLIGALFIGWLAIRTFLAKPALAVPTTTTSEASASSHARRLTLTWLTTLGLTLTNPATIFTFAAIFTGIGLVSATAPIPVASATVIGVFLGSALWWLLLSSGVGLFRARFDGAAMRWVNRVSGLVLLGFAVYALLTL